jgi:hypothetical protein
MEMLVSGAVGGCVLCPAALDGEMNITATNVAQNITNDRSDCPWTRSVDIDSPLAQAGSPSASLTLTTRDALTGDMVRESFVRALGRVLRWSARII